MSLDHVVPATTNQDPPKDGGVQGETITIRDFYGRVIDTVGITAKGDFQTPGYGVIPREDLGEYILKISGHPAASR